MPEVKEDVKVGIEVIVEIGQDRKTALSEVFSDKGTEEPFIEITSDCCNEVKTYQTREDFPLESVKCKCGNYFVLWTETDKIEEPEE